jgi:hypothetical protein
MPIISGAYTFDSITSGVDSITLDLDDQHRGGHHRSIPNSPEMLPSRARTAGLVLLDLGHMEVAHVLLQHEANLGTPRAPART